MDETGMNESEFKYLNRRIDAVNKRVGELVDWLAALIDELERRFAERSQVQSASPKERIVAETALDDRHPDAKW
jgi:hypothetical protein